MGGEAFKGVSEVYNDNKDFCPRQRAGDDNKHYYRERLKVLTGGMKYPSLLLFFISRSYNCYLKVG